MSCSLPCRVFRAWLQEESTKEAGSSSCLAVHSVQVDLVVQPTEEAHITSAISTPTYY